MRKVHELLHGLLEPGPALDRLPGGELITEGCTNARTLARWCDRLGIRDREEDELLVREDPDRRPYVWEL